MGQIDFLAQNILGEEGGLGWGEVQFEGLRKALGDVGGVCKVSFSSLKSPEIGDLDLSLLICDLWRVIFKVKALFPGTNSSHDRFIHLWCICPPLPNN